MICEVSFLYSIAYFTWNLNLENAKICANICLDEDRTMMMSIREFHRGNVLPQRACSCYDGDRRLRSSEDRATAF